MSFESLNLHPLLLKTITRCGYTTPTPIQAQAIPVVLAGNDLVGSAETGTGKTAAFILPALQKLTAPSMYNGRGPRVLILTPTRELAQQVAQAAVTYSAMMPGIKTCCIVGGMPYPLQKKQLSKSPDFVIATPGRLIDHLTEGRIDFSRVEMLVIDEADRMLDMGFIDEVNHIIEATPETRQTLLFSATMAKEVVQLTQRFMKNPVEIHVKAERPASQDHIEQRLLLADDMAHKNKMLSRILEDETINQTIVFTATKRTVETLVNNLIDQGHVAAPLHGDMRQNARNRIIEKVRRGSIRVLVATDVAARGIDVPGISHVINFDMPNSSDNYVHRIGRTGRAGLTGKALSFASCQDYPIVRRIEKELGITIERHSIEGLEARFNPKQMSFDGYNGGGRGGYGRRSSGGSRFGGYRGGNGGGRGGYGRRREDGDSGRSGSRYGDRDGARADSREGDNGRSSGRYADRDGGRDDRRGDRRDGGNGKFWEQKRRNRPNVQSVTY